jgi:hypothetical protein
MRWLAGLLLFVGMQLAVADRAAAAPVAGSVTMFSESGDYIGGGTQRTFDTSVASDRISASASSSGQSLSISVSGGTSGDSYALAFVAPSGTLRPGVYTGAQRAPFREAGRPGIEIFGDGRGCNTISGSFEVRDLVTGAEGTVQRAWIVYEQHCEGGTAALFGEVRLGAPATIGPQTAPTLVRWPARDVAGGGQAVPVSVSLPAAGGRISHVAVVGDGAADFVVRIDDCSGAVMNAADSCEVWVRFVPTAPGTRRAWLEVTDAAGTRTDVPLQGFAYGGETGLTMISDPGDYIGGGATWSYGPASRYGVSGSRTGLHVSVTGANGDWWYLDFVPAQGDVLAPGTYTDATRYPFNGSGAGLDVSGEGRGCNELDGRFTVNEFTTSGGALRSLSISFEQHCEHSAKALRGTFKFRSGDTTSPASWMVSGNPPDDQALPPTPTPTPTPTPAPTLTATPTTTPTATTTFTPTPTLGATSRPDGPAVDSTSAALIAAGERVSEATQRLTRTSAKLRPARVRAIRAAATRLAAELRTYRRALTATAPAGANRRAALAAVQRQSTALRTLERALSRYRAGHNRAGAARTVRRSLRIIATAAHQQ